MYQLYVRLKAIKAILKLKNIEVFGGLQQKVDRARCELALAQSGFINSHGSRDWSLRENDCLHAYLSLVNAEENFLKQKSRNQWLNLGDGNSAYFHNLVKVINVSNLVKVLKDDHGSTVSEPYLIKELAVGFYEKLLGHSSHLFSNSKVDRVSQLIQKRFSTSCIDGMQAAVSREEVRRTVFSMKASKAPGPDGFSAGFFQKAWPIVGRDVTDAVIEFFYSRRLLREANVTIITLVPKRKQPAMMGDFRPISCCNIVYKVITKILANQLRPGLNDIVNWIRGRLFLRGVLQKTSSLPKSS
jgi:hypothetical protein